MADYPYYKRISIFVTVFMLLLTGCEKRIDNFDFLLSDPKMVINAPFISDSTMIFHVSRSIGIMEKDQFVYLSNAVAQLWQGDALISEATYLDTGFYSFDFTPLPGDSYLINVESPGFPGVQSEFEMPESPELVSLDFIGRDDFSHRFKIVLNDIRDKNNYYGISLRTKQGWVEWDEFGPVDTVITGESPQFLSSSNINVVAGMYDYQISSDSWDDSYSGTTLLIDDSFFDGEEISVDFYVYDLKGAIIIGSPLCFIIESYDESYVKYLYSMEMYNNSYGNPIAEKVSLFNNIKGGLGLAYGKTVVRDTIYITPDIFMY